jgi:exopolysaccharide biosynthesis predicted pyruvyltransferase EpsI/pyruvate-formate lyase-activating enzyme
MEKPRRFILAHVPVFACNLHCKYCYLTLQEEKRHKAASFKYDPTHIANALSAERLGGICLFNMCGDGETLLPPESLKILYNLLAQGHYIEVVTNGTLTKRFDHILRFPDAFLQRLLFKFSFHYLELLRLSKLEAFFSNVQRIREAGCSFTIELTPHDELIPYIEEIKKLCRDKAGSVCHATIARDDSRPDRPVLSHFAWHEYIRIWGSLGSPMFSFKTETFNVKRREFCYAGCWALYVNLGTGITTQCYGCKLQQNIFEDLSKPIVFVPVGKACPEPHCYNSHGLMTMGLIPSIKTPTYAEMRNRVCGDGREWLTPGMKLFISSKLCETNKEFSSSRQFAFKTRQLAMSFKHKVSNNGLVQTILQKISHLTPDQSAVDSIPLSFNFRTKPIKPVIFLLGTPEHGNLGDHAITKATHRFLGDRVPQMEVIEITANQFRAHSRELIDNVQKNDIIVVSGGGYLGNLWINDEIMVRNMIGSFPNNRVVIFPQTIYFADHPDSQNEIRRTREVYQMHTNLHVCLRDRTSYDFFKSNVIGGNFSDCRYIPDIATYLIENEPVNKRADIALCFRSDREQVISPSDINYIENCVESLNETFYHLDTNIDNAVTRNMREISLKNKFDQFRSARLVITDRLHGMIFSAITGTPCIAMNNRTGKVAGVYQWLKYLDYVRYIESIQELQQHVEQLLNMQHCEYHNELLEPFYRELAGLLSQ